MFKNSFSRFSINKKLWMQMAVMTGSLICIGMIAVWGLNYAVRTASQLN